VYLVQILLPLTDNQRKPLPRELFGQIQQELIDRFQGLTAYTRAPAEGLWKPRKGTRRDEIIVYEIMANTLEKTWWRDFRERLEKLFKQESVVIRAQLMEIL
jgi:hypothetical protein